MTGAQTEAAAVGPGPAEALATRFDPARFDSPLARTRVRLEVTDGPTREVVVQGDRAEVQSAGADEPDTLLHADGATWQEILGAARAGMRAFEEGRLGIRRNLHLGIGFLAATAGTTDPASPRVGHVATRVAQTSFFEGGSGEPVLLLHGLGATKASLVPLVEALIDDFHCVSLDLPGCGESAKPIGAPYDAPYLAAAVVALMDALGIERAHLVGNSMGGRVALEVGLHHPERVGRLALLAPSLAWKKRRGWAPFVRPLRPELGLLQPTPRRPVEALVRRIVPGGYEGWQAAGVDEFLRTYAKPRGRAAFYAQARNILLEQPTGPGGFWTRLPELRPPALFVWGKEDRVVPMKFARHVEEVLPHARHLELDCGHVPQLERPEEAKQAVADFLREER